jgi:uncharacterized C2H2 Zn-finger protein
MFYVYEHIRPDTNQVFYVGKGHGYRLASTKNRNKYWQNIVNKVSFKAVKVVEHDSEELILLAEIERIDQLRKIGVKLVNVTDGGQGISGLKHSDESKKKMSDSRKLLVPHKHTDETKEKIRKANTGVVFTEERKRKISEAKKGQKMLPQVKEALRLKMKNFKHSEETLKRMSVIQRAMPKLKCPHCDFVGNAGNVARWHLDNCSKKGE